ncbi:MAG: hypothetical protein U9R32_05580, partial [Bacteroidota bacterium]|nr:hypothetical protein [Bacteroidota bacterium]
SFIDCITKQKTQFSLKLIFCINQPEEWYDNSEKRFICDNNHKTADFLRSIKNLDIHIIDKYSKHNGWTGKQEGVGWGRKLAMDYANNLADKEDFIFSLDVDTFYPDNYFEETANNLINNPKALGAAIPYYHPLPTDKNAARAILRYEIYMRYYALNLLIIKSPYKFSALGSAIALPVWAYRKVGGITPKKSGEDFYFIQKLIKSGEVLLTNPVKAYPTARFSDRVFFGTGPAMIKGDSGDWSSYPIYHPLLFNNIKKLYNEFSAMYSDELSDEMRNEFSAYFDESTINKIRQNSSTEKQFIRQCHVKFDGLRILQYLKNRQNSINDSNERILKHFFENFFYKESVDYKNILDNLNFDKSSISDLDKIRDLLCDLEEKLKTL